MPNRPWKNSYLAIFIAILLAAASGQSRAQTAADDPCLRELACQRLLAKAQSASQDQRYEDALIIYKKAHNLSSAPWLLVNIGRMQHKLGRYQEAKNNYLRYLESPRQPQDDEQRTTAQNFLAQAESQLSPKPDALHLSVSAAPAAPPPAESPRPLYKKWWLWTIVGGVVAGGVAATIAGVYLTRPSLPSVPADAQFHPF